MSSETQAVSTVKLKVLCQVSSESQAVRVSTVNCQVSYYKTSFFLPQPNNFFWLFSDFLINKNNIEQSTAGRDLLLNTFPLFDSIFRANNLRLQEAEDAEEEEDEEEDEEEVYTALH